VKPFESHDRSVASKDLDMATLNIIRYGKVSDAIAQGKASLKEQREYNTNHHGRAEILEVLPTLQHFEPQEQSWILLEPWLDLIMSSQGLMKTSVHRIRLPGAFLVQLLHASRLGLQMGHLSLDDMEDLAKHFPKQTTRGDSLEVLINSAKFFVRLDTCSLKDALIGSGQIKSVTDIWTRLATSARGMRGVKDLRKEDPSTPILIYLLPWRDDIRTELEYRVYCSPGGKLAAVSQYHWHSPWYHAAAARQEQETICQRLLDNCEVVHKNIMAHPEMTDVLRSRGFVFDVVEDPGTQTVKLIELNDFGALSGCGSCLFHSVKDAMLLYGFEKRVEVRVTA